MKPLILDAMHTTDTMSDPFGEIRAALHTGDFATDLRSWVISGVAFAVAALGAVMFIGDIRDGEYLVAATIAALPLLMIVCIWLLTHRDLRSSARVRRFIEFMAAELRSQRDLIEGRSRP